MSRRTAAAAPLILCVTACGGGSPAAPPPPVAVYDVEAIVFYDENGNGAADPEEIVRVPDVELQVGTHTGRSEKGSGKAVISGVPAGRPSVAVRTSTLPPFYAAPTPVPATVPQPSGTDVMVPLTLAIGNNGPNTYMGFGDSITVGEGSSDDAGYRDRLAAKLGQHFGRATVINQGIAGTRSNFGAGRIDSSLIDVRPAYTLILYGTNDWNQSECKTAFPCFTIASLRQMVLAARFFESLPVLATIPPCNVGQDDRATPERQEFYRKMNELIRPMAREEGAVVADLEAAFLEQPDLASLFVDHIHPNDAGYEIIASEFFAAISRPATTATGAPDSPAAFGFVGPPRALRAPAVRGVAPGAKRGRIADE